MVSEMILYHGSKHQFDWPQYASIVEHAKDRIEHPRGLHVSTTIADALLHGEVVYEIVVSDDAPVIDDLTVLQEPRHKLFQRDCAVVIDSDAGEGVIVDFDAIDSFFQITSASPT